MNGRSPHGERGLKLVYASRDDDEEKSLPPRGAWIEIKRYKYEVALAAVAPPTGSVD